MAKLILVIPAISTLWRDVTKEFEPPHVKIGCDTGDRVAQTFIRMLAYMLRRWAAAAVKSRWPLSLNGFEGEGWYEDCRVYE